MVWNLSFFIPRISGISAGIVAYKVTKVITNAEGTKRILILGVTNIIVNRIYNKILDRDWFSAHLFVT